VNKPRASSVWVLTICLGLLLIDAVIGLSGGGEFFSFSTAIITPLVAFVTSFGVWRAWLVEKDVVTRRMWAGMGLGFFSWALADTIWSYYDIVLQQDIPYPSLADLFWGVAYLFFFIPLVARLRHLPVQPTPVQKRIVWGVVIFWTVLTSVVVLYPIAMHFETSRFWEGILNIFFPTSDAVIAILATMLLILLGKGRFSLSWRWIFVGLSVMTVSDLFYSYATWRGLYYPDDQANFMSVWIDATYIAAYLISAFGVQIYRDIAASGKPIKVSLETRPVSRFYAMLFTNRNHTIISASSNLPVLIEAKDLTEITGKTFEQAFGLERDETQAFFDRLIRDGVVKNEPATLYTVRGYPCEVRLTAMADYDVRQQFNGANIAIQANLSVPEDQRLPSQKELQYDLNYLLSQTGILVKNESQSIQTYFIEGIKVLSGLVFQFGGEPFQKALFDEIQRVITEKSLPVQLDGLSLILPEDLEGQQLADVLHLILDSADRFVSGIVGYQVVRDEMSQMEKDLDPVVRNDVRAYRLAGNL